MSPADLARRADEAARELASLPSREKNEALDRIARLLDERRNSIIEANKKDLETGRREGLSEALLDRLRLTPDRIDGMIDGIRQVRELPDPVGEIDSLTRRPNGLKIGRQRVPLGVIALIYESRPNVTVDASVLCLKAGNATLLRGGSEACHSNYLLVDLLQEATEGVLPEGTVQILRDQDRSLVNQMLKLDESIDVVIPRGGEGLIEAVAEQSTIPVIKHHKGVCHTYVSREADPEMARSICLNAKTQRTSVCNAMETLLLDRELDDEVIRSILGDLRERDVELRAGPDLRERVREQPELELVPADESDWDREYLDLVLSVRLVDGLDGALDHLHRYGSNHSDAIVTENYSEAERFLNEVDSAAVYVNASTRFTDGYEFGLGAEIGISTERLHARGPMGLRELTIPKYVIYGNGQVRS